MQDRLLGPATPVGRVAQATIILFTLVFVGIGARFNGDAVEVGTSNASAWACSKDSSPNPNGYGFYVSRDGAVSAINNSSRDEPSQMAFVYINNVKTSNSPLSVPALESGESVYLGSVNTPGDEGFEWLVSGTKDCKSHNSYPPIEPMPTATPTVVPTQEPNFKKHHYISCERLNASMLNDSAQTVLAEGYMWDKDGNLLGNNSHLHAPGPEAWFNISADTPEFYDGKVSWFLIFSDPDTGNELARYEDSAFVDGCGTPPTPSPTPTATPTEPPPTEEPTEPPPTECISTDLKGRFVTNDHFAGNPVQGFLSNLSENPECADTLWVHIFGANQEPETDGWLENQEYVTSLSYQVPTGTNDMEVWVDVPAAGYCWYQVDLVDTSEVRLSPYYITWDYAFVKGEVDCGQPPEKPKKPVCPTCGPHMDEFVPGGVSKMFTSETPCEIVWDEENNRWCDGMTGYAIVLSDVPISILDHTTWTFTSVVLSLYEGEDYYVVEGDALPDQTGETWSVWYGTIDGLWDQTAYEAGEYQRAWEVVGTENVKTFFPCGRQPGPWDTPDGIAQWRTGHNVSEWATYIRDNFNMSYADAFNWAMLLQAQGIGGSLPLPGS